MPHVGSESMSPVIEQAKTVWKLSPYLTLHSGSCMYAFFFALISVTITQSFLLGALCADDMNTEPAKLIEIKDLLCVRLCSIKIRTSSSFINPLIPCLKKMEANMETSG
jgi:hypothetical protein